MVRDGAFNPSFRAAQPPAYRACTGTTKSDDATCSSTRVENDAVVDPKNTAKSAGLNDRAQRHCFANELEGVALSAVAVGDR